MATGQQQTPARTPAPQAARSRRGDWAIAAFMLGFFALAYLLAQEWPFRAALFPQIISTLGFALTLLKLLGLARQAVRGRRSSVAVAPSTTATLVEQQPRDTSAEATQVRTAAAAGAERGVTDPAEGTPVTIVDDQAEEDESLEYVFATAGARAWSAAIGWVVAFFVAFFVLGVFVAVPLFAVLYLRFSGRASWRAAVLYAAITGALIYAMFRLVVYIDLPTGYLPFLQL